MTKVRATKDGFYGGVRRRTGEVFHLKEGAKVGKWMEEVEKAAPAVSEAKAKDDGKAKAKDFGAKA